MDQRDVSILNIRIVLLVYSRFILLVTPFSFTFRSNSGTKPWHASKAMQNAKPIDVNCGVKQSMAIMHAHIQYYIKFRVLWPPAVLLTLIRHP
jgi:hypothetical protein